MNGRRIVSIGLLTAAIVALSVRSWAADPPKPAEARPAEFLLIPLKHADANKIAPVIQHLAHISALAIPQTNSIGISADKGRFAEIRGIIEQLDVAPRKAATQDQMRVYSLKSVAVDKNLENMLNLLLRGRQDTRWAIDPARNLVMVYGDEQITDTVTALLAKLDSPPIFNAPQTSEMQVRIIWLVSAAATEGAPKLPEDLGPVLPTLARMGIDKPALAAQTLISTSAESSFTAKGNTLSIPPVPCDFTVTGSVYDRKEGSRLALNIQAVQGKQEVCRLETEIAAPLGHFVVLGMTPTQNSTSVFVVQVRRVEPTEGAGKK